MDEARLRIDQGERLRLARLAAGYRSARDAALRNGWPESSYRAHEAGTRTIGQDDAERYAARFRRDGVQVTAKGLLFGDDEAGEPPGESGQVVGVRGVISAGGLIATGDEQPDPSGNLFEVTVPFWLPPGTIAFRVAGASMHPKYEPDDIVLCAQGGESPERLLGCYAAVATPDGNRFLKKILRGSRRGTYHLESHNAPLMTDRRLAWASGIISTVHAQHWRRFTGPR
ncbi:putative phage repressor [Methylobacterium sp. 4-46]|uniref:S24 family peptidase n=1 Tax=unclassified Methylobacterium TaxID=2615210 RepID=UPI000165CB71|nr:MULTISPECIES: S24/S26 family peptidase [Methylobacterium]ACA20230.1 putative phage repressor [Methylobacterium sp. 4-46]WFT79407.1 S24/S26 family peptidase [Methylobacterium nodulans]